MNKPIALLPFEIYELHLFQLVAIHGSFTRAAAKAHITQSAITRQIQGMEKKLGTLLLERNTRSVQLTAAGKVLFDRSFTLLKNIEETICKIDEVKNGQTQKLKVGVCRSIALSYLPGFFVGFRTKYPKVQLLIETDFAVSITSRLLDGELDVGLIHSVPALPRPIVSLRRIKDEFTLIYPKPRKQNSTLSKPSTVSAILNDYPFIAPQPESNARLLLDEWLDREKLAPRPAMELDNFDLMVNLVALGLGCSIVPHRALPLFLQRGLLNRFYLKPGFSRYLQIVARKGSLHGEWVQRFGDEGIFLNSMSLPLQSSPTPAQGLSDRSKGRIYIFGYADG